MHHKREIFKFVLRCSSKSYCDDKILNLVSVMKAWMKQFSFVLIGVSGFKLKQETIDTLKQIVDVKIHKISSTHVQRADYSDE